MLFCCLLIFFQNLFLFFLLFFRNTIRVSNSSDSDQARHLLGLIRVHTVCNGYKQRPLVGKEYISQSRTNITVIIVMNHDMLLNICFH